MTEMNDVRPTMDQKVFCPACPLCGSPHRRWRTKQAGADAWPIDQCTGCGFAFANPRPTLAYLMDFYRDSGHESHVGAATVKLETLEAVLKREQLEPNSSLDAKRIFDTLALPGNAAGTYSVSDHFLDIGCGYGFFSAEAQRRGLQVTAIELARTERSIATQMLGLEPIASSFEAFEVEAEKFSVVLMSQILEHALDCDEWVSKASRLLVPKGYLVIALPNFSSIFRYLMQEREPYICPPAHINFFSVRSLSRLLEKHGFRVVDRQWVTRIPQSALRNRLGPGLATRLAPLARMAASAIDAARLGMMINLYAQKA